MYQLGGEEAGLAEWREVEAILRARGHRPHSTWKLFGNGSVGSQTLTGIPVVARLCHDPVVEDASAVWPFEVTVPELRSGRGAVIHAEVWPSLIGVPEATGQVRDQTQVRDYEHEVPAGAVALVYVDYTARKPEYYIVPAGEAREILEKHYAANLEQHGGRRPRTP